MKQVHHLRCLFFVKLRTDQFESPDPNLSNNQPSKGKDANTSPNISWVFHRLQVCCQVEQLQCNYRDSYLDLRCDVLISIFLDMASQRKCLTKCIPPWVKIIGSSSSSSSFTTIPWTHHHLQSHSCSAPSISNHSKGLVIHLHGTYMIGVHVQRTWTG